jgi:hypothetical protein
MVMATAVVVGRARRAGFGRAGGSDGDFISVAPLFVGVGGSAGEAVVAFVRRRGPSVTDGARRVRRNSSALNGS